MTQGRLCMTQSDGFEKEAQNTEHELRPKRPTCFVIMPISDPHGYEAGHFGRVYEHLLKPAISLAGFEAIRADDENKTDYIVVGIIQKIIEADVVLCDYSSRNHNVMYELGLRHAFNKKVVLIKDKITDKVFDIQGLRYTEYDESLRIDTVKKDIDKIYKSITETSSNTSESVNSPIQLAKIRAAELPEGRTISADTKMILDAISAMKPNLSKSDIEYLYFSLNQEKVTFSDGTFSSIGEEVYANGGNLLGVLIDIDMADKSIRIREPSGRVSVYQAHSARSNELSAIPF